MKEGIPLGSSVVPGPVEGISIVYNDPEVVAEAVRNMSEALHLAAKEARENGPKLPEGWRDRIIK